MTLSQVSVCIGTLTQAAANARAAELPGVAERIVHAAALLEEIRADIHAVIERDERHL